MNKKSRLNIRFRRLAIFPLIVFGIGLIIASGGGGGGSDDDEDDDGFVLYDNFNTAMIDRSKWSRREFVRRIDAGVLVSELTRIGSDGTNGLNLVNPDTVNKILADVTVNAVTNTNAVVQARVMGDFYNDGITAGGGFSGDIFAGTAIHHNGVGLVVAIFATRCDNSDCSATTDLLFNETAFGPIFIVLGIPHEISVAWDEMSNTFTYGFDGASFNFPVGAPVGGPPASADAFKGISTRIDEIGAAGDGGFISATFDNVEVNNLAYDDFSTALIDRSKWLTREFVRHLDSGKLESVLTSYGADGSNSLEFIDPAAVSAIRADVMLTDFDNTNARARARLRGVFYNDGTPGLGNVGDVFANIDLRHDGAQLVATYGVDICDDPTCDTGTSLVFDNTTLGPISLGVTYKLTLDWNGSIFTFGLDNNLVTFNPKVAAPVNGPARAPFMGIGTRVNGIGGPAEGAYLAATFDNVEIKP